MTRRSIKEYAEALRPRYMKGTKEQKGRMLDEFPHRLAKWSHGYRQRCLTDILSVGLGGDEQAANSDITPLFLKWETGSPLNVRRQ